MRANRMLQSILRRILHLYAQLVIVLIFHFITALYIQS